MVPPPHPHASCGSPAPTRNARNATNDEPFRQHRQDIDYVGLTQSGRLVIKLPKLFVEEVSTERATSIYV